MSQSITLPTTLKNMGDTNAHWGVCGFTSSLYAMWELDPNTRPLLMNAPKPFSVLAEIKTYLRMLQADGNRKALLDIEAFCQSFGGLFKAWTVDAYIDRVNKSVTLSEDEIKDEAMFSIAMPPYLVADYLRRMWGYNSKVTEVGWGGAPGGDAIIGMVVPKGTPNVLAPPPTVETLYHRLVHYMYRRNGRIWSWGHDSYGSVEAARSGGAGWVSKGWKIGWVIAIGKKM